MCQSNEDYMLAHAEAAYNGPRTPTPEEDPPCPRCERNEGAYERGECAACGYRACVISRGRITGDIVCTKCGTNCDCLICAVDQGDTP